MNIFRKNFMQGMLLLAVLMLAFSTAVAQGNARVRFVHAIPGGTAIDVFINGSLALTGLEYGSASTYLSVPAGSHTVTVTPAGIGTPLWEQSITAETDKATTFIASSPATLKFDAYNDNLTDTGFGKSRLLLVHALAGGSPVDIQLAEPVDMGGSVQQAGTTIAPGVAYGASFGSFDVPAQTYVFNIVAGGSPILSNLALPLSGSTSHIAVIYGTPTAPEAMLLAAPTDAGADAGMVRLVHGVVGAPAVDVFIDETLVAPGLSSDRPTEHIALPSGEHQVVLKAAGTEDDLLESAIEVTAGAAMTVVAVQGDTGIELKVFPDPVAGVTASSAIINVVNTIPGSASIDVALPDNTPIATGVAFGATGQAAALIPAITTGLKFTITIGDRSGTIDIPPQTFYGGVYYNLIALDGGAFSAPTLLTAPTSISQGLASAPGAGSVTIATGNTTSPETVAAEPTLAAPTPGSSSEVVTAPTEAAATPQPEVLPPATQVEKIITARVLLDPGANLQLREYPRSDARSLGLAPSGTTFVVIGREGAPVALVEGGPIPPEAEDFVDPVTLLDPEDDKADLVPEETWLNVDYSTPDGGTINAWVNALYLDVRNEKNERIRLADLIMIGSNVPGQTRETALTPPPIPEDQITAIVFNLNQGTNLNIRRTPETQGEVLARLPSGTTVEVVGFKEDDTWVFIRFRPSEGGEISGWVNALYVRYRLNNEDVELEDIKAAIGQYTLLPLYEVIPDERRGAITGGASGVTLATPDPLLDAYIADVNLDPGANLQLRRAPDANSESLNLIPSGTRLVVESRSGTGEWLKVTFEGESGWISSRFVAVTFNSRPVELIEIPVDGAVAPVEATAEVVPAEATAVPTTESAG